MGIFSFLKKLSKEVSSPPTKKGTNINGEYAEGFIYDDVYDWANDPIDGTNLFISDLIFLWVIDRLGSDFKKYPIHLSRNYDIKKPEIRVKKLIELSLVTTSFETTDLGKNTINQHRKIIELHKKGWISEEDRKKNLENYRLWKSELAKYYDKIGELEKSAKLKQEILEDKREGEFREIFLVGENLSKERKYRESNNLLLPLSENEQLKMTAPLFERIAKNYRGLKEFEKEVEICERFLKEKQPFYGGDMWKDVFYKRIEYARKKLK